MMDSVLPYLPAIAAALGVQFVGILSPGPSVLMVVGNSLSRGRGAAVVNAAGVALGSGLLALATVLGLSALVAQISGAVEVLRILGAAYLAWLAIKAFKRSRDLPPLRPAHAAPRSAAKLFAQGFLLQVCNPKALFFWLAIAAMGGLAEAPWPAKALLVSCAILQSFLGHGMYGWVLGGTGPRAAYEHARRWIEAGIGGLFGAAAIGMALGRS